MSQYFDYLTYLLFTLMSIHDQFGFSFFIILSLCRLYLTLVTRALLSVWCFNGEYLDFYTEA